MRQIRLFIILMIGILLTACQPEVRQPTMVTSNDSIGGITLNFPEGWTVIAEQSPIEGRHGVTLVRFPDEQQDVNIDQFPVIRIAYDSRETSGLTSGAALQEIAIRQAETLAVRAIFQEPETIQLGQNPAIILQGQTSSGDRHYYFMFVDFQAENGLVTLVLTSPNDIAPYEPQVQTIASSIRLSIKPGLPTPTVAAEVTSEVAPEKTNEATPESTAEVNPESTEEAAIAATETGSDSATTDVTVEVNPETTNEVEIGTTPDATEQVEVLPTVVSFNTPAGDVTARTITLSNGFTLITLDGWKATSNDQNFVGLTLGDNVEKAMLERKIVPSGEASISVELGSASELFTGSTSAIDLRGRLELQISATANYRPPLTYNDIQEITVNDHRAASVMATSEINDQYTLLLDLGAGIFGQVRLTTAPGEGEAFIPSVMDLVATLSPAQQ